jgi:phosphoglycerol transferase MdoB-like AlkP superfamily enzyme
MSNESSNGGGVGFFSLLGLLFIALKLTGVIDWSWWWVTAPLWGGALLVILVVVLILWLRR